MDFEGLIGFLFLIYFLGSIIAAVFRRERSRGDGPKTPQTGRRRGSVFGEVLDMDELERRLREARDAAMETVEPRAAEADDDPAPEAPAPIPVPPPAAELPPVVVPPVAAPPEPRPRRPRRVFPAPTMAGDPRWETVMDDELQAEAATPPARTAAVATADLPPAVQNALRRGKPWQAAFIMQEVLGPPRGLRPHRPGPQR